MRVSHIENRGEMKPLNTSIVFKGSSRQGGSTWIDCPRGKVETPFQSLFSLYPPKGVGIALHLKCLGNDQCYKT